MRRVFVTAAMAGVALVVWLALAPTSLGGSTSYLVTHGASMEPRFHTGDLAVIRRADSYHVGDIAAYYSDVLHTVVMHRIVAIQDGRYTFKGDNNNFVDPGPPTRDLLIGKLAFRIPQGGLWAARATSPPALGALAFLILVGGSTTTARRRRRKRPLSAQRPHPRTHAQSALNDLPPWLRTAAGAVAVVGLMGLLLAALSFSRPSRELIAQPSPTHRSVTFSYTATVPPSAAYDTTTVTQPDPLFRKLVKTLAVHYAYHGAPGTIAVATDVSASSGWHTTIPLAPPTRFTGQDYDATVVLSFAAFDARARAAVAATGVPIDQLLVAVTVTARAADGAVFAPALDLTQTPSQVSLANGARDLTVSDTATSQRMASHDASLGLLGRKLAVPAARIISLAALVLAGLAAAAIALMAWRWRSDPEVKRIRRRYAPLLLGVDPTPLLDGHAVVEVEDFAALGRLAERHDLPVLHWSDAGSHSYVLQHEGTIYLYRPETISASPPTRNGAES